MGLRERWTLCRLVARATRVVPSGSSKPEMTRTRTTSWHWFWIAGVLVLLAMRVPTLVEPAGGDQQLYAYAGKAWSQGAVPYLDAWDQKPPGIHLLYAGLWLLWPSESVVAAADLAAAGLVAWLLILLGRRLFSASIGYASACVFLLLGNPALQRMSGVWVRGQCETFIALAVVAALVLATDERRRARSLALAGICLGAAIWLKYNAVVYALPVGAAVWWLRPPAAPDRRLAELSLVALGATAVSVAFLAYFALYGALGDLWLATIAYNLTYSGETYGGPLGVVAYLIRMPVEMARTELLWFVGGAGAVGLAFAVRRDPAARLVLLWTAAGVLSIALNGARGLPQYFIQVQPALALAAAAGLAPLLTHGRAWRRVVLVALILVGLWRVGTEPGVGGMKLGGLPGAWTNLRFDWSHAIGEIDRTTYLARFERTGDKYVPLSAHQLAAHVSETTQSDDSILIFGFSAGVYLEADRRSASRFYWSRPVAVGFEQDRAGFGSSGLLADLERDPPALIALQRHWGAGDPDPIDFFLGDPMLRGWLEAGYVPDREMPEFSVWRRRPSR